MMTTCTAWLLAGASLLAARPTPQVDPILPDSVRPVVKAAIEAELDAKRGPGNALRIIEKAQTRHEEGTPEAVALRLRRAAIGLRRIFLTRPEFPETKRYEQALSTFAQLELTEPGLREWLERTLRNHPEAKATIGPAGQRQIHAALLVRGDALPRKKVKAAFKNAFAHAGFSLRFVPAKKAPYVLKVGTAGTKSPYPDQRAVRVMLGIEHVDDGEIEWQSSVYRTMTAPQAELAVAAGVDWVARVGGRDVLIHWLGTHGLPTLVGEGPLGLRTHEHEH